MTRQLTKAILFWDAQDPNNEGWAYRCHYNDGHEESGPYDGLDKYPKQCDLDDAIVAICYDAGVRIRHDDVSRDGLDDSVVFYERYDD